MRNAIPLAALVFGLAISGAAVAKTGVKVGSLECTVSAGSGYIVGSSRSLNCTFTNAKGKKERYRGSIEKIGIDLGTTDESKIGWLVFSAGETGRGALAGTYVGAAADASIGFGGGAKVLVGGSNKAFTLQPVSLQAQTGINFALGIASMSLEKR